MKRLAGGAAVGISRGRGAEVYLRDASPVLIEVRT
jgi:hypothetical protein